MAKARKAPAKKKTNGYKMPDPLPPGEILQDIFKKQWILGPSIGKGGFGEIYSAKSFDSKAKDYPFVIKIEPHDNGPLFVEMHFYARNAKEADIKAFKDAKNMKKLGMPHYIGSGSHVFKDDKYRFIVMEKFATDIWKLFIANNRSLPTVTVYKLGLQMLDSLEYIHHKGYVHADLKAANILISDKDSNQAYLVDFGLAGKYTSESEFKPNPKKMHDGTIEYLSRDAHQGVQTRRGDIEILAYNMIHWLCGKLPWEVNLTAPKIVQESKEKHMKNIKEFMTYCFPSGAPKQIEELLKYINKMAFDETPDYEKIKKMFVQAIKDAGGTESSPLSFKPSNKRKSASMEKTEASPMKRGKGKAAAKSPVKTPRGKRTEMDEDTDAAEPEVATPRKRNDKTEDMKENAIKKKATPAKRTRRVNTIATVSELKHSDENQEGEEGVADAPIMNKEMMRIMEMKNNKNVSPKKPAARTRARRTAKKLNSSFDDIQEVERLPISKRALAKMALNVPNDGSN